MDPDELREALELEEQRQSGPHESQRTARFGRAALNEALSHMEEEDALEQIQQEDTMVGEEESFELGVFGLDEADLDDRDYDSLLDEISDEAKEEALATPEEDHEWPDSSWERVGRVAIRRDDLPAIPLFSKLNASTFVALIERAEMRTFEGGVTILSPASTRHPGSTRLFIVLRGEARVAKERHAEEREGDEIELGDVL